MSLIILTPYNNPVRNIITVGGVKMWSDGTAASSVYNYMHPTDSTHSYTGDTGSGLYAIDPAQNGTLYSVWGDTTTDGGGYTVISGSALSTFPGLIENIRQFKDRVVIYEAYGSTLYYTLMTQLSQYAGTNITISQSSSDIKVNFVPNVTNGTLNGFNTNGTNMSFTNCDTNPSSYFDVLSSGTALGSSGALYALSSSWIGTRIGYTGAIPSTFFSPGKIAFGGCGAYNTVPDFAGISGWCFGFK
jgi:hypothetical protein